MLALHSGAQISVAEEAAEAFQALDTVMQAFGYAPRPGDTGAFNCRKITGGDSYSPHAYGIAVDINWNSNPFRADNVLVTDMPTAMVAAIKQIRTREGAAVFRWGGDYRTVKDAMHFEIVASRTEMHAGIDWSTVRREPPDPSRPQSWPVFQLGATGPAVRERQDRLSQSGFATDVDGSFGRESERSVKAFQQSRDLDIDGVVGLQTWTALLLGQPAVKAKDSPVKVQVRVPDSHPSTRSILRFGSKGMEVVDLQRRLIDHGFDPGDDDGVFGPLTQAAVEAYQESRSLEVDGIAGRITWTALLRAT